VLRCRSSGGQVERDGRGDVRLVSVSARGRAVRLPSADLVAVVVRRGGDGVVCVSYRLAGPVRLGSEFAVKTRLWPMGGASAVPGVDQQRYEVQLTSDGKVHVSRPHGETRYPVRARVTRHGDTLDVARPTLLRPGEAFGWRVESRYLPRFPLGDAYVDRFPDGSTWVTVRADS
jgi:hypothetical protein